MRAAALLAVCAAAALPLRAQVDDIPYLDSPDNVTQAILEIAAVGPRDHVVDLGSGDGRIVIAAARRFGATGLGVEIVPALVTRSRAYAQLAGVSGRATFLEQDLFTTDLSTATVVTMYLLPEVNLKLRPQLLALAPGTRVVSHDWDMGDWLPDRTRTLPVPDKAVGREKLSRVHLWTVPAPLQGQWCAAGRQLELSQQYQWLTGGRLQVGGGDTAQAWSVRGRVDGRDAVLHGSGSTQLALRWTAGRPGTPGALAVTAAQADWLDWAGLVLTPCQADPGGTVRLPPRPAPAASR